MYTITDASAPSTSSLGETLRPLEFKDSPFRPERTFCCRQAVHPKRGLYFAFNWEQHRQYALGRDLDAWRIIPDAIVPKTPRKRQRILRAIPEEGEEREESKDDEEYREPTQPVEDSDEEDQAIPDEEETLITEIPQTPSRKRKRAPSTPRRRRAIANGATLAAPTPHSKAALRARANRKRMTVRPPPPDRAADIGLQLQGLPKDPWLRAMHVLHVAARPEALPCREEEYGKVLRSVEELVEEGSGGCVCKYTSTK